jgi:Uma2 family endonuclease
MTRAASIPKSSVAPSVIPPLSNGDRLSRDEFERRYDATPGLKHAELIEGRVFVAPPVSFAGHGSPHVDILTWVGTYRAATPGVGASDNGSVRLDLDNMPQPDGFMIILPKYGGQARIDEDDYLEGAPELIVEVAPSSVSYDLHDKLEVYRRDGVREYIVWRTFENEIDYFILRGSQYVRHAPDHAGRYRSEIFPGLWLDSKSLLNGDLAAVLNFLNQGISSAEHAEFAKRLQSAAKAP